MAYDEELADRIRKLIGDDPDLAEKRMFGGLAFLIGGNMAVAASEQGGILVRVDPDCSEKLLDMRGTRLMEMRDHLTPGWLRVDAEVLSADEELARWVGLGVTRARALPRKE